MNTLLFHLFMIALCVVGIINAEKLNGTKTEIDIQRPSLPNNSMIQGWWECTKVSVFCVSPIIVGYRGMTQFYLQFDEKSGTLIQSREDATVNCSSFVYNREYLINGILYEYSMFSINSTSFTCSQLSGTTVLPQNLFINATYIGQTTFDNINAYQFNGKWTVRGREYEYQAFTSVDNEQQILGWTCQGYIYRFLVITSLNSFNSFTFQRPSNITCNPVGNNLII